MYTPNDGSLTLADLPTDIINEIIKFEPDSKDPMRLVGF